MDQVQEKPKILLCHAPHEGADADLWSKFTKILGSISQVEDLEVVDFTAETFLAQKEGEFDQIFLDQALIDQAIFSEKHFKKVILIQTTAQIWESYSEKEKWNSVYCKYPRIVLKDIPATDLLRVLHLFLVPKKNSGVAPLMEKGSTILGEKVQGIDNTGLMMDRLSAHLDKLNGFKLKNRISDLRQILTSLIFESFRLAQSNESVYPTVDFQVSATTSKLAVNMRFSAANLDKDNLFAYFQDGKNIQWSLLGNASDLICITAHEQYKEIEIHALITREKSREPLSVGSVLIKTLEKGAKKESLLVAPQNYQFYLLSEVKTKNQYLSDSAQSSLSQTANELNFEDLPPQITKKIEDLETTTSTLRENLLKKENSIKENLTKLTTQNKELIQKRNEILKLTKVQETLQEGFKKTVEDLEKKLAQVMAQASSGNNKIDPAAALAQQDALNKLETSLRGAEIEKNQVVEKLSQDQKRMSNMETKYNALFKEINGKDKEVQDLKATLLKLNKENANAAAKNSATAETVGAESANAKLKESETREATYKQEIKKLAFKLENHDKNLKAIQLEAGEKQKLIEQKLQAAKTKELELLKKVDELSSALKKAAKAA